MSLFKDELNNESTGSSNSLVQKLQLDPKEFLVWKMKMMAYLESQNLFDVVESPISQNTPKTTILTKTAAAALKEKAKKNSESKDSDEKSLEMKSKKAYSILLLSLQTEQIKLVLHVPRGNANGVWEVLLQRYERKTTANKAHIREKLHSMKMETNELFDTYVARLTQLILQLADMGEEISNGELMFILFNGLPMSYSSLVQTLKVSDKMEFEEACGHIRDYQEAQAYKESKMIANFKTMDINNKINNQKETANINGSQPISQSEPDQAFAATQSYSSNHRGDRKCFTCNRSGHISFNCEQNKDKKKCEVCRKIGHNEDECGIYKRMKQKHQEKRQRQKSKSKSNPSGEASESDEDDYGF